MVEQEKKEQQRRERRLSSAFPSSCAPAAAVHGAKARRRRSSASRQNSQSSFMEADDVKENDVPAKEQPPGGQPFQHHPPIDPRHTRKPSGSSFEEAAPPVPPSPSYRATPYWMVGTNATCLLAGYRTAQCAILLQLRSTERFANHFLVLLPLLTTGRS
jgi:hypothetical protein